MYAKDDRVKHPTKPEWGIGRILETAGTKVKVFFVDAGEKTIDTAYVQLAKIEGSDAVHPMLDNLRLPGGTGRKRFKSLPDAKLDFLKLFPNGFEGEDYLENERNYKVEAHELMINLLAESELAALIKARDYADIVRRALQMVNKTNLIFPNEKMALKDGLAPEGNKQRFSETLFDLLYGKEDLEQRFTAFADCLLAIGAAKWTVATYFLYLRYPEEHMFMKPSVTQNAAEISAFELNYHPNPNWLTYKSLLDFSRYLSASLKNMGLNPRDMIDVQSFMWCIDPKSYQGVQ